MARGSGRKARWAAALGILVATATPARAADPLAVPAFRHRLSDQAAAAIEPAVLGATRRFAEPECGRVLTDFADREGRLLEDRLADLGVDREAYLGLVVFVDGRNHRACHRSAVLAVTNPGSRLVGICPAFYRTAHEDHRLAEGILIHETLHTLGLGENPPSSQEINQRIFQRCGR